MIYINSLEAELNRLERDLRVAELNNWEFDISILKDEIKEVETCILGVKSHKYVIKKKGELCALPLGIF